MRPILCEDGFTHYLWFLTGKTGEKPEKMLDQWKADNPEFGLFAWKSNKLADGVFIVIEYLAKADLEKIKKGGEV